MHLSEENADIIGLNLHVLALCRASGITKDSRESFGFACTECLPTETNKKKNSDSNLHPTTLVLMVSFVQ